MRKVVLVTLAVLACSRCGSSSTTPSSSLVGDWGGRIAPAHFAWLYVRFSQTGSGVEGVACIHDPSAGLPPERRGVVARDLPVLVIRGVVTVLWKQAATEFVFMGRLEDGIVSGHYANGNREPYPMTLQRGGNYCGL